MNLPPRRRRWNRDELLAALCGIAIAIGFALAVAAVLVACGALD